MRRLRNVSWEMQTGVDTKIPDLWEITVLIDGVFPCSDDQWEYLVNSYNRLFETVYSLSGGWEDNEALNVWTWVWLFKDKTWVVLNFKSIKAGAWIQINSSANELEIVNNWTVTPEVQVDIIDDTIEYIIVWDKTTDRVVKLEYSIEWDGNYQEWFMYIVHNGTNADFDHQFSWVASVLDNVEYTPLIDGNNIVLRVEANSVWTDIKLKYKKSVITITT